MTPLDGIDPARTLIDAERLDDYLDALRREGFAVGIDERLRSWRLVSAFVRRGAGAEERPTLRVMLASLLSRSAEELRRAQDVFDGIFARQVAGKTEASPSHPDPLPVVPPPSGGWIKDKAKLLAVVLGLLVLLVGIFFYSRIPPAPEPPKPCISKCGDETTPPPTTEPLPQPDATWTLATVIADLQTRTDPRTGAPLSAAPTLREASRAGWPPATLTDGRRLSLAEFVARTGLEPDIPLDFDDQAIRASLATGLGLSAAGNEQSAISPSLFHRLVEALRGAGGEFTSLPTDLAERANLARSRLPPNTSQSTNQDELRGAGDDLIDRALFTAFPQIRSNPVFDRASWAAGIVTSAAPAPSWLPLLVVPPPLLVLIWLLFRRRDLRKSYLRARAPNAQPLVRNVAVERPPDTVYNRSQFTRSAQALHARQQRLAFGIDPDATVEATARAGGLFTKVDGVITSTPAYVVLIEIKTMADHEARRLDRLVGRLKQAGVEIERFFYFGTAEYLYPEIDLSADPNAPSGLKPRPIEEVAAAFFEARLIIMGEAHGFLDPVTLKARSWTQILLAWSSRTLLTPRPFRAWDIREAALAKELDLPLGRATQEGLAALGDLLCLEGQDEAPAYSVRFPPEGDIRDIPNRIALEPHRWLSNRAPDDKEWTTLRRSLLYYHDRGAYLWLCVAAVYPALLWDLTIYLGLTLKDGENSLYDERRLAALARLPWFREHGMPAWLRVKLRDELKHDHPVLYEQAIVLLWSLLASDLAAKEAASTTSLRIARDLNAPNSGQRPFADEIFLDTMVDGTIPEDALPLSHAAQRHLAQLLGTVGKRDMLSIIVTSLLAVAAWWLVPKPSDGPLVPGAFLPITVLGILAMLAGLAFAIYDHGVPTWATKLAGRLRRPAASDEEAGESEPAPDRYLERVRSNPNEVARRVGDNVVYQPTAPGFFEQRRLKRGMGTFALWAWGVGAAFAGQAQVWSLALPEGGWGGVALAAALIIILFCCLVPTIREMACAMPYAGAFYVYARTAFGLAGAQLAIVIGVIGCAFSVAELITGIFGPILLTTFNLFFFVILLAVLLVFARFPQLPIWVVIVALIGLGVSGFVLTYGLYPFMFFALLLVFARMTKVWNWLMISAAIVFAAVVAILVLSVLPEVDYSRWALNIGSDGQELAAGGGEFLPKGLAGIFMSLPLLFWIVTGIEYVPIMSEEAVRPRRNVSRSMLWGLFVLSITGGSLVLVLPAAVSVGSFALSTDGNAMAFGFQQTFGPSGFYLLSYLFPIVSVLAFHLWLVRLLFVMSRVGLLSERISNMQDAGSQPRAAILVAIFLEICALGLTSFTEHTFTGVALLCALLLIILQSVCFIYLRVRFAGMERPYRSPWGIPGAIVAGVLAVLVLVNQLAGEAVLKSPEIILGILIVVCFSYCYWRRRYMVLGPEEEFALAARLRHLETRTSSSGDSAGQATAVPAE